jgi:hypothetical protein
MNRMSYRRELIAIAGIATIFIPIALAVAADLLSPADAMILSLAVVVFL